VTLSFTSIPALVRPLVLLVPETFQILPGSCGSNCTITLSGFYPGTQRQRVNLSNTVGGAPVINGPLQVQVQLPPLDPADNVWLLQSFAVNGEMTAWGAVPGFPLEPMQGVSVFYNALVGSTNTRVIVTFSSRFAGGTEITLQAPMEYGVICRTPDSLRQLSLPGLTPDCSDNFGSSDPSLLRELTLALNGTTLGVGQFSFGVSCDLPTNLTAAAGLSTIDGSWSLTVHIGGEVVESIFGIPPLPISDIGVSTPVLAWSLAEADERSMITLGFTAEKAITGVRAVLFVLPERVLHDAASYTDFTITGPNFPYVQGEDGLMLSQMSSLRLLLQENAAIPQGSFRFRFPVILPWEMPSQNIWLIALCSDDTCVDAYDSSVIVTLLLAGFNIGERSTIAYEGVANTASGRGPRLLAFALTLAFLRCISCS
jgi:hypothetical protein